MRQITTLFITTFLLFCLFSCKKTDRVLIESQPTDSPIDITAKFFALDKNVDPIVQRVVNEIKRRNEYTPFVNEFTKANGFPIWGKALL